ncbi:hypothetical protein ACFQZE_08005 [Paenibacillus sp. GCM10027627]|uniref:hypothetical protein n=1 Tax=unclassified Paenibacillus TaxID=185978 RepID=UPI0036319B32
MKRWCYGKGVSLLLVLTVLLAGCTSLGKRSPEEWLSLSYSGLAAMDQYAFSGSMSIGVENGVVIKPQMFDGKVVNHKQLTIQSDKSEPLNWNPVEVLKSLSNTHESVEIVADGELDPSGAETLTLRVQEQSGVSKERWSRMLKGQMEQLGLQQTQRGAGAAGAEKSKLLKNASNELNEMLNTLEVQTQYDIVIDKRKLVPLKVEEKANFLYHRKEKQVKEFRHALVRFQSFDGAAKP